MRFTQIIDSMVHEGKMYRQPFGTIFYYDKAKQLFYAFTKNVSKVEIDVNYYISDSIDNFEEYDEYNLSFSQALELMKEGKNCTYKGSFIDYYYIRDNKLIDKVNDLEAESIIKINDLMKHKWKVVE